jgi:hypothetical protein
MHIRQPMRILQPTTIRTTMAPHTIRTIHTRMAVFAVLTARAYHLTSAFDCEAGEPRAKRENEEGREG